MINLKCPHIESKENLCDREAEYYVNGTIYCDRHARRVQTSSELRKTGKKLETDYSTIA